MQDRVRHLNQAPFREKAKYVLYWTQMARRAEANFGLNFAAETANERGLPLLVYEGLTCTYREANDRIHTFMLQAVPETARRVGRIGAGYCFYLRRKRSDANDVLYRLAEEAAAVVTDDYPTFIAARHNASVPAKIGVAYYAVDSSCIVPMQRHEKREYGAYTIRPRIHRVLAQYLTPAPQVKLRHKWQAGHPKWHTEVTAKNLGDLVASCEIDHRVSPSLSYAGGRAEAEKHLEHFLEKNLRRYARERNEPSRHATSDLSPYLHFGYVSSLEVALAAKEHARRHHLIADEFLEELIVRRELAFNFARFASDVESFADLPDWCKQNMKKHARDRREQVYSPQQFEAAETHDPLWNATQKEMLLRGKIHGYYRMYWGKKIIEWSESYEDALATMMHIHDRYALDGRDPNTYTNILWCFGLHDRPWTERPIFGNFRWMSFEGMKRKTDIQAYIDEISQLESSGRDPYRL
ncbi:MAG TPA: deoxyribodipyrimidine photo-lyase [Bryobacteraceae bacterium]